MITLCYIDCPQTFIIQLLQRYRPYHNNKQMDTRGRYNIVYNNMKFVTVFAIRINDHSNYFTKYIGSVYTPPSNDIVSKYTQTHPL